MIGDQQKALEKKTQKNAKMKEELQKGEVDLEKANNSLNSIAKSMLNHQRRMKKEVMELVVVKDQALQ